jgi:hypothetical protein
MSDIVNFRPISTLIKTFFVGRGKGGRVMVNNANFNNISVILMQSVLLVDETGVPRENHRPVTIL